jgi:pimeloyl-ACP methyl ester carboxylesterase
MKKTLIALFTFLALGIGFVYVFPEQALKAEYARQRLIAGADVRYKDIQGERWSYLEAGQGELIVLVHGYTGSKENWLPIMGDLAKTHRVIAVDLPGWGESTPKAGEDYGPLAQAARLNLFLKSENEPVALLVGHSMGGMISGLLSVDSPMLVQRLVLMSSAGVKFRENEFARKVQQGYNPFAVYDVDSFLTFMHVYLFIDPPYIPEPLVKVMLEKRLAKKEFEATVFTQIREGPEAFLLEQFLTLVQQPVGLLWCDLDQIIDPSAAQVFSKGLKTSQITILKGCGHMPMMEQPGPVADFLLQQFK